jgi:hypothetical protein
MCPWLLGCTGLGEKKNDFWVSKERRNGYVFDAGDA